MIEKGFGMKNVLSNEEISALFMELSLLLHAGVSTGDALALLAKEGVAVVVLSSEAQEIIRLCDRALVLYHGQVQGELAAGEITDQAIMRLATGGSVENEGVQQNG